MQASMANAGVICLCSVPREGNYGIIQQSIPSSDSLPVLVCVKSLSSNHIRLAEGQSVRGFFSSDMAEDEIEQITHEIIRHGELKKYLESCRASGFPSSPHTRRVSEEILHAFPRRLREDEMAQRLGKSRSRVQKFCRQFFGMAYTRLLRRLWVYQALRLTEYTTCSNGEIALQLNYSEESNFARDFRKELKCSPSEARLRLSQQNPEKLLH